MGRIKNLNLFEVPDFARSYNNGKNTTYHLIYINKLETTKEFFQTSIESLFPFPNKFQQTLIFNVLS